MKVLILEASQKKGSGAIYKAKKLWMSGVTLPLLAALTPNDVEVEILNEVVEDIDFDCNHDLIAITAKGCAVTRGFEIADEFRKRGKKVVMGGIAVSLFPESAYDHVDSVVIGEAELVWEDILRDFEKGNLKKIYNANKLCDLKNLPTPRYDLMEKKLYGPIRPAEASRGCVHKCSFCSPAHFYNKRYRVRSIEGIIRDIEAIKSQGVNRVLFVDDHITANKIFARQLFKELIPLKIKWNSQASVEAAQDEELIDLIAESGCDMLTIGFESINQKSLASVNKKQNLVTEYGTLIESLRKRRIHVTALIMLGLDQDDESIFDSTYNFFMDAGVSLAELFILVPPPGTKIYDELKKDGRLLHENYSRYKLSEVVYKPKLMTAKALKEGFWETYERFYTIPAIFKRLFFHYTKGAWVNAIILYLNLRYRKKVREDRLHPGLV